MINNDIKEAVVLLGGLGTRMLPLSKVVGKEMLPIFDAPLLHKLVLEAYNSGIVDVSYKYPKMYVIRPQFFIPIITLIRNASLKSLDYKKQLKQIG